ncbi:hypothetical protein AV521_31060 [Streptomyces sp. IMTB 2501]|nr:hypothetical protein AV521_31060 [Streptomyces sp. IMTB 2501]
MSGGSTLRALGAGSPEPADRRRVSAGVRDINASVSVAKRAGRAVTAGGTRVRPVPVPALRDEAGAHPKPHPTTARHTGRGRPRPDDWGAPLVLDPPWLAARLATGGHHWPHRTP